MKKKAIFVITVICAALCFLLWQQKTRLLEQFSSQLGKNQIQVAEISGQILPAPQFILNRVKLNDKELPIAFNKIVISLNLSSLFGGDIQFTEIEFYNGHSSPKNLQNLNLTLKPTALYLKDISALAQSLKSKGISSLEQIGSIALTLSGETDYNRFHLQGSLTSADRVYLSEFQGIWDFKRPIYGDVNKLEWEIKQGNIKIEASTYQLDLTDVTINKNHFPQNKIQITMFPNAFSGNVDLLSQGQLNFQFINDSSNLQFSAKGIELERWFALLKLPVITSGKANITGQIFFNQQQIEKGEANLEVFDGKVKNINLLTIVAQRLPINYDIEYLQDIDSPFEQLVTMLHWDKNRMEWKNILLQDKYFQLSGQGSLLQSNKQCDFLVNLKLRQENYQNFRLPLHFFGDCDSPQYRIESTNELRQQLKEQIKKRFSR